MSAALDGGPVAEVLDAVRGGEVRGAKLALHPYVHWSEGGVVVRGRTKVLAMLADRTGLAEPAGVELRDGQIYRWSGPPVG